MYVTWLISGTHSGSRSYGILAPNLQQIRGPIKDIIATKISSMSVNAVARGRAIKLGSEYHLLKLHVVGLDLEH